MWNLVHIYVFLVAYHCAIQARMVVDSENEAPLQRLPLQPITVNETEVDDQKGLEYQVATLPVNAPFYNYDTLKEEITEALAQNEISKRAMLNTWNQEKTTMQTAEEHQMRNMKYKFGIGLILMLPLIIFMIMLPLRILLAFKLLSAGQSVALGITLCHLIDSGHGGKKKKKVKLPKVAKVSKQTLNAYKATDKLKRKRVVESDDQLSTDLLINQEPALATGLSTTSSNYPIFESTEEIDRDSQESDSTATTTLKPKPNKLKQPSIQLFEDEKLPSGDFLKDYIDWESSTRRVFTLAIKPNRKSNPEKRVESNEIQDEDLLDNENTSSELDEQDLTSFIGLFRNI